jgi:hypothetical protein
MAPCQRWEGTGATLHQKEEKMPKVYSVVNVFLRLVMVGGAFLGMVSQGWAQVSGDVGSQVCRETQLVAHAAVTTGQPQNPKQLISTAAHVVSPHVTAGTITSECGNCIMGQFVHSMPIEEQTTCGPEALDDCGEFESNTFPPGTYFDTCTVFGVSGCTLNASCETADQDDNWTTLNLSNCDASQDISNENGVLTCTPR